MVTVVVVVLVVVPVAEVVVVLVAEVVVVRVAEVVVVLVAEVVVVLVVWQMRLPSRAMTMLTFRITSPPLPLCARLVSTWVVLF